MNAVEAYIQFTPGLIDDDGEVTEGDGRVPAQLHEEFHAFIVRVKMALPDDA